MRNLLPTFIAEQYRQNIVEGTFPACALFVDISGFTPMTESLMLHGSEGAEVLSQILNRGFKPMIDAVYRNGGFISNFPGDAFTAIFPGDVPPGSLLRIIGNLRSAFGRFGLQKTRFGEFDLAVRTGMSVGLATWGIVGDDDRAFYFRGEVFDNCAAGKQLAGPAEFIIDEAIQRVLASDGLELSPAGAGFYRVLRIIKDITAKAPGPLERHPLNRQIALRFLPREVVDFHGAGEFRDVASVFIFFDGISDRSEMNRFVSIITECAKEFAGYVKEIEFTEGGMIPCFFGAPVTFENTVERALSFIITVRDGVTKLPELSGLRMRAGISYGQVFCGMIGGPQRSQYAIIGTKVNLAARLGAKSAWNEVHVSETVAQQQGFEFRDIGEMTYKGIAQPIRTYTLIGDSRSDADSFFSDTMVGRAMEMSILREFSRPIFDGAFAGIAYIYGEAGIGKSQLAHSFHQLLGAGNAVEWFTCQTDQILRKPFNPFISFLRGYFSQAPNKSVDENRAAFENKIELLNRDILSRSGSSHNLQIEEISQELTRTKSIIGALIGLPWERSLYEQLDARGRYENTLFAIKTLFVAESLLHPVVIQIEDLHWIDSDSAAAITALTRNIPHYPILLLITSRYNDDGTAPRIDLVDVPEINLRINNLGGHDLTLLAEAKTGGRLSRQLQQLLLERSGGNPFFVQQLLLYFTEHEMLEQAEDGWRLRPESLQQSDLPETISSILIARIDRLSQRVKEVVKAAAVIGHEFEITILSAVLKHNITKEVRHGEQRQIWALLNELRYIFKHALLRDAAYQMQIHARLRELHKLTAEAMEEIFAENLALRSTDIAYHYEKAEVGFKAIHYLEQAGDYAKEQYQNLKALELYERLLAYLGENKGDEGFRIDISMKMADVLQLIGDWRKAEELYQKLVVAAGQASDRQREADALLGLGRATCLNGDFDDATDKFTRALQIYEATGERSGISTAVGNMGAAYAARGEYDHAMEYYNRKLMISKDMGDRTGISSAVGGLGTVYYARGEYERAMEYCQQQLAIAEELGDNRNICAALLTIGSVCYSRGEYDRAMECFQRHLAICRERGDRRGISSAVGNMGVVYNGRGEYDHAMECYEQKLVIGKDMGDRTGIAAATGNMGMLYMELGEYDRAIECCRQQLEICEVLGDRRNISTALGNIGNAHAARGEYDLALMCGQRQLAICEELGDRSGTSLAIGRMGAVYCANEEYERALEYFSRAATGHRAIGSRHELAEWLAGTARVLLELIAVDDTMPHYLPDYVSGATPTTWRIMSVRAARQHAGECVAIASEISKPKTAFAGRLLLARLDSAEGQVDIAVQSLSEMLERVSDDDQRAELHFWLWRFTTSDIRKDHRNEALHLYTSLLIRSPKYEYRKRIEELNRAES